MGGVEQVIDLIANGSQKLGIQSNVLSLSHYPNPPDIEINGYQVHLCKMDYEIASCSISLSVIFKFFKLAKQADLIHYHFPWPFMDIVHFVTRTKKPTLVTYHSDIVRQKKLLTLYKPIQNLFLKSVNRIIATSPNYLSSSDMLIKHKDKVSIIPIGLDLSRYPVPTKNTINDWKKRLGSKFFLFIGAIRYYKGLHILIEAAKYLDYPVVIVGSGPVEDELKRKVANLKLTNIIFLGHLLEEDKVALLILCYAVVFPSHLRSEAFGISLLEGAMYGKALISSEIGTGTSFININNQTGIVIPPGDPLALKNAIQYLWEHPEITKRFGINAKQRYWDLFTAKKMIKSYVDIYTDLCK